MPKWDDLPVEKLIQNPEVLFRLTTEWLLYYLPTILTAGLISSSTGIGDELAGIIEETFCTPMGNISMSLSPDMRIQNQLDDDQREFIIRLAKYLDAKSYTEGLEKGFSERFSERIQAL